MIYDVKLDGESIYDVNYKELTLVNPHVKTEVNTAGSFEFTLPPYHLFYDKFSFKKTVEVFEDGELIFTGRPVESKVTFNNAKDIYCEGALAYLNDSIYPYKYGEFDTTTVKDYFNALLNNHNKHVPDNRKIYPGKVDCKPDQSIYRQPKYERTWNLLQTGLLNAEGGYFFLRKEGGTLYLDYLSTIPYSCNQPVDFGKNILDFNSNFSARDICTRLIPLGMEIETGQTDENGNKIREPLTCASVNNGDPGVTNEDLVKEYGTITRTVKFDNIDSAATLLLDAQVYLQSAQWDGLTIEITAAEMHYLNRNYEKFIVGQRVRCRSKPHGIDKVLNLLNLDIDLTSGEKKIILGTLKKRSLTEIYKQQSTKISQTINYFSNYTDNTILGGGDIGDFPDVHIDDVNNIGKHPDGKYPIREPQEEEEHGRPHKDHYADETFNKETKKWEPKKDEKGNYMNGGHIDAKTGEYVSGFKSQGFAINTGGYGFRISDPSYRDVNSRVKNNYDNVKNLNNSVDNVKKDVGDVKEKITQKQWKHEINGSDDGGSHTVNFVTSD